MTESNEQSEKIQTDGDRIENIDSMGREKFWEENNTETKENQSLEDNLPMVNYIMLHRIYDLLTVISNKLAGSEDTAKLIDYHNQGFLLGPVPSFTPQKTEEK